MKRTATPLVGGYSPPRCCTRRSTSSGEPANCGNRPWPLVRSVPPAGPAAPTLAGKRQITGRGGVLDLERPLQVLGGTAPELFDVVTLIRTHLDTERAATELNLGSSAEGASGHRGYLRLRTLPAMNANSPSTTPEAAPTNGPISRGESSRRSEGAFPLLRVRSGPVRTLPG